MRNLEFEFTCLARILPLEAIREVLEEEGRAGVRLRKLPPELVTWLVIGMGLFRSLGVSNVLRRVVAGLTEGVPWGPAEAPHTTSITQARDRLGWEAVRRVFQDLAGKLDEGQREQTEWRGHAVYALDGTTFLTPDTDENEAWFGRPGSSRGGTSAFPQLRAVMVLGAWTHTVVDAVFGPYTLNETKLAEYLLPRLESGAVYLLDRAYYSFVWPVRLDSAGVYFVIRTKKGRCAQKLTKVQKLGRGDWLCELNRSRFLRKRRPDLPDGTRVRLLRCQRKGFRPYDVITNLLSRTEYPAAEVAALYLDRWEIESGYRELKVHMAGERVTFRSKKPGRVLQEAYGLLIAYDCVRALMCEAALEANVRPVRLSFTDCLWRVRWSLRADENLHDLLQDLARCVLPARRSGRRFDRAVKIKMSSYPRKRRGQRSAPTRYQRQAQGRQWRGSAA